MIYADNAATTKLDIEAFESMKPFLLGDYGNASQAYSFARPAKKALKEARTAIAKCIGAFPEEIYFTSGGTKSDNWAIKGTVQHGDHRAIVTSAFEHHAVLHACEHIERLGYPVAYIYPTTEGVVLPEKLATIITAQTRLVSVMMVNNEIGTVQPIQELCALSHRRGALFHTDAVQAVGHMPIDVHSLTVDFLSASAHKFNGPKGIGFLYIRQGAIIEPFFDGGAQEYGLRAGTENIASIVGMAVALQKNCAEVSVVQNHLKELEQIILFKLDAAKIDYCRNGNDPHIPGNLSLSFKGCEGEALLHRLDLMGIIVSTGSACDSKNTQVSHVLQAIKANMDYAVGTIRISLGKNNTREDSEKIAAALIKILSSHQRG